MQMEQLATQTLTVAKNAGKVIMDIYNHSDFDVQLKNDRSPLTKADTASHNVIIESLQSINSHIPILSEESDIPAYAVRKHWPKYWLIDPLDGTKEFIKRNGEFTVNIALIENGKPVMGVVYAPALDKLYWGFSDQAFCQTGKQPASRISVIRSNHGKAPIKVVASRSHRSEALEKYLAALPEHECLAMGSSLKLCLVAEGRAHLYPRIGPTMEWDTAAADAVVRAAGGSVTTLENTHLVYNKENLLNPYFLVRCGSEFAGL